MADEELEIENWDKNSQKNYLISGSIHPKSKLKLTGREERRVGG